LQGWKSKAKMNLTELVNIELRMHLASMSSSKYLASVDSWLDYLGYIYTISPCLAFSLSYVFILLTYWRKQGWARLKVKVPYARIIVVFLCEYLPNYFVFFPSLSHFNSINQFGMVYPHSISNPPISTPIQLQEYIWYKQNQDALSGRFCWTNLGQALIRLSTNTEYISNHKTTNDSK
jgi:hypothetical protein